MVSEFSAYSFLMSRQKHIGEAHSRGKLFISWYLETKNRRTGSEMNDRDQIWFTKHTSVPHSDTQGSGFHNLVGSCQNNQAYNRLATIHPNSLFVCSLLLAFDHIFFFSTNGSDLHFSLFIKIQGL